MASEVGEGSGSDSSKKLIYDVFLSFRGEELRPKFIGHLHQALLDAGIKTFHDTKLPRGREIQPELYKAIESSKLSIVTLSPGYADSKWCLNELAKIMECKRSNGHIVLPVFYDVDPRNVRHQLGKYKDAFDKHEKLFEDDEVKRWRECLRTVGYLSGLSLKNHANGDESKFLKLIIKEVVKLHESVSSFQNVPVSLLDLDRALRILNHKKDDVQLEFTMEDATGKTVQYVADGWIKDVINIEEETNNLRQNFSNR